MNLQREKETLSTEYDELKHMFDTANECLEMLSNVQVKEIDHQSSFYSENNPNASVSKNLFRQNDLFLIHNWTCTENVLLLIWEHKPYGHCSLCLRKNNFFHICSNWPVMLFYFLLKEVNFVHNTLWFVIITHCWEKKSLVKQLLDVFKSGPKLQLE